MSAQENPIKNHSDTEERAQKFALVRGVKTVIRRKQVEARTGLSRSSIYDLMRDGVFPRAVPLGSHSVGWVEEEINAWIDARIAARDQKHKG